MSTHFHVPHGVRIASDLHLTDVPTGAADDEPQVSIRIAKVPHRLANAIDGLRYSQTDGEQWLFSAPGVARYLVTGGKEISVEAESDASEESVMAFLLGTTWAACCHQRGLLIMHASVASIEERCVAFVGVSGAGKSTLAALLAARGHRIASDDTCVLTLDADGAVRVHPSYPRVKLWSDGLSLLPTESAWAKAAMQPGKFKVSMESHWLSESLRLHHVLELADDRDGAASGFQRLSGLQATLAVTTNTFRPRLVQLLGRQRENFAMSAAVAKAISVHRWCRPWGRGRQLEMIEMLERWMAHPQL